MKKSTLALCLISLSLCTAQARAETVKFEFEAAGNGSDLGYGSLNGGAALIRNGFVVDVAATNTITDILHWHETNSITNYKVPDRPADQKGVLWRDAFANKDPLFFAPASPTFIFSLQSLVVGGSLADAVQTTGVRASAWLGGRMVGTVDLAAPTSYASYAGSDLGQLQGLKMDRLEFVGLSNNEFSYYMLDDVVFQTSPVPEPETYAMLGAGLLALAWRQRRAKKSQKIGAAGV
jgi:PEP-CTERM motif